MNDVFINRYLLIVSNYVADIAYEEVCWWTIKTELCSQLEILALLP